jgi:hemerythrin-like metal-binding protein
MKEAYMVLMEWQDSYSLGIVAIDLQHRVLMDMTNRLHKAALGEKNGDDIEYAMNELLTYVEFHFSFEERLLAECGYPSLIEHRDSHQGLLAEFRALQADINGGRLVLNDRVMNFLQGWLTHHIVSSDRDFAPLALAAERKTFVIPRLPVSPPGGGSLTGTAVSAK